MRNLLRLAWVGALAVVAWLSLQPQAEFPVDFWNADKLYHAGAYFVLGMLGMLGFPSQRGKVCAAVLTVTLGIGIELLQGSVPGRMPSVADGVANTVGVVMAWVIRCFRYGHRTISY